VSHQAGKANSVPFALSDDYWRAVRMTKQALDWLVISAAVVLVIVTVAMVG
jgi:hypothetical protein